MGEQLIPRELYRRVWQYYETLQPGKRGLRDLQIKLRNEAASSRGQHIRTETWGILARSVAAVSQQPTEVLSGNEFTDAILAIAFKPLVRWLIQLKLPDAVTVAKSLLVVVLSRWMPRSAAVLRVSLSVHALAVSPLSDLPPLFAEIALATLMSQATTPVLAAAGLVYVAVHATGWWLRRRDALQCKLHAEIACRQERLLFGGHDLVFMCDSATRVLSCPISTDATLGTEGRPTTIAGATLQLWRYYSGGCTDCGARLASSGYCVACHTCATHGIEEPNLAVGEEFPCCTAKRAASAAAVERPASVVSVTHSSAVDSDAESLDGKLLLPSDSVSCAGRSDEPEVSIISADQASVCTALTADDINTTAFAGFNGVEGLHAACRCAQHQGATAVAGARWGTCPVNFGFWQTDVTPCHICEPNEVSTRHDCRCEVHRPPEDATLCKEGWPHSGSAGEPCHACRVPADDTYWLHEFLGIPRRAVANAEHPNLAIPSGPRDHRAYPGTCIVEASALRLNATAEEIWDQLLRTLTVNTLDGAFNDVGLDERAFHALGLIYERTIKLSGAPVGVPNTVGLLRRDILRFHRTRLTSGLYHWAPAEVVETSPATNVRLSKLASTPTLRALLADIDAWRGPDGLALPSQWRDTVTQPARAKQYLRELKNGVIGTIAREQGRTFTKDFLPKLDALHDLARPRRITVMAMSGSPGCGKSAPFKTILSRPRHHVPGLFLGVFPRNSIMRDWSRALNMDRFSWMLNTFELALRRHARLVIVDEISLLPPGYLDLLLCLRPGISHVILLGDAVQCRHHAIEEQSELNSITPEVEHWFRGPVPYLHISHTVRGRGTVVVAMDGRNV